jgi:hypothetical protein
MRMMELGPSGGIVRIVRANLLAVLKTDELIDLASATRGAMNSGNVSNSNDAHKSGCYTVSTPRVAEGVKVLIHSVLNNRRQPVT